MTRWTQLCFLSAAVLSAAPIASQDKPPARPEGDIKELKLRDWKPRPMLKVTETKIDKPAFPVIDVHNHLRGVADAAACVQEMDRAGVRAVVNLDGYWGDRLKEQLAKLDNAFPGRFLTYAQINFEGIDDDDWTARSAAQLEESFKAGAKGLKIHKTLGLYHRYKKTGKLVAVDDLKIDPLWALCGKYKRPVEIHIADPAAFFTPLDQFNERWHELNENPGWLFYGKDFPSRETLLEQFRRIIERNPQTTFIGAHFGNNAEDPDAVGQWLDRYPNFYIDFDARISELGRRPYSARRFFIKYQDRILFGTDTPPRSGMYQTYYRFLETDDEYWDCAPSHHLQGFWMIYGIYLPREVLEKIYLKNAEKLLVFKV